MALDIRGKSALVTGAGRGICLAFAVKLLQGGCNVLIADLALTEEAKHVIDEFGSGQVKAIYQRTDVTDWSQLQAAFDKAITTFGGLDIVCPGAGLFEPPSSAFWHFDTGVDSPATSTYKTLEINITHPIRCTQLAIDNFLRQGHGHGVVIHLSSVGAQMPGTVVPLYVTSKAAISHFVRSMGALEPAIGIRVNAIAPANVKTPLWTEAGRQVYLDESKDEWVTPERVADVMLELVSKPEYVGGTVLEVGVDKLRKVELLNDPGTDTTARGFTMANVSVAAEEVQGLIGKNFGKHATLQQ